MCHCNSACIRGTSLTLEDRIKLCISKFICNQTKPQKFFPGQPFKSTPNVPESDLAICLLLQNKIALKIIILMCSIFTCTGSNFLH